MNKKWTQIRSEEYDSRDWRPTEVWNLLDTSRFTRLRPDLHYPKSIVASYIADSSLKMFSGFVPNLTRKGYEKKET